ncbi:Trk system potassium uptake protein TrkA [bacterium HR39]|nr:Trk system potassium uptake protein TrkA [bacterium HR39]
MKVVVCGAGLVGFNIARYLARAGHDVTVIDRRPELVRKIGETLDLRAVLGHAALPGVLEEAGAADADMLIAVTHHDEVNMIACQVAHSLFGVPTKIARVREQAYLEPRWQDLFRREHLPIDHVISPEVEVAHAAARLLAHPGSLAVIPFAGDRVRLVGLRLSEESPVLDQPLRHLTQLFPELQVVVVGVVRDGRFFVPTAEDRLLAGDEVYFVSATAHLGRAMHAFGYESGRNDRIVVVGGGNIGLYLARDLERQLRPVGLRVIEKDPERAEHVAQQLAQGVVLCGDAREEDILEEAGVRSAESVVCVTDSDEVNVMVGVLAKDMGARRAMSLYNSAVYRRILAAVGVDVGLNPREITVSSILQYVRRGRIRAVHTLLDGEAEIYEIEALETSPLVGRSLRELRIGRDAIVGAIVRGEEVLVPRADTVIEPHDRVVVLVRAEAIRRMEKLFAVRADYFG